MCSLKERTIQRKLLGVADLTLQSAVEKACAAELTEKETIALHGGGVEVIPGMKFLLFCGLGHAYLPGTET